MSKEIYLTGTNGAGLIALVSDQDYARVSQTKWHLHPRGYAHGRPTINGKKTKKVLLHRYILGILDTPAVVADHINHDVLDNRRENLRVVTQQENLENRSNFYKSSHSNFRGVTFSKPLGAWVAKSTVKGHHVTFGPFDTEIEAAHVIAAYRVSICSYPYEDDVKMAAGITIPPELTKERQKALIRARNAPKRAKAAAMQAEKRAKEEEIRRKAAIEREKLLEPERAKAAKYPKGSNISYSIRDRMWRVHYGRGRPIISTHAHEEDAIAAVAARKALDNQKSSHSRVWYNYVHQKWYSRYGGGRKENKLGPFDTEYEAICAYDDKKAEYQVKIEAEKAERAIKRAQKNDKTVENEAKAIKRMAKRKKGPSHKLIRARKQYLANKIRIQNGMEPKPLK